MKVSILGFMMLTILSSCSMINGILHFDGKIIKDEKKLADDIIDEEIGDEESFGCKG